MLRAAFFAVLAAVIAGGCGPSFTQLTARQTGCAPGAITITDLHDRVLTATWRASCGGREYACRRTDDGITRCLAERGALERAADESASPSDGVRQSRASDGRTIFTARFTEDPFGFLLSATAGSDADGVVLSGRVPAALVGKDCTMRLMIDGEQQPPLAAAPAPPAERDASRVRVRLPYDLLPKLAPPFTVAGRVCEEDWRLGPTSQGIVAEFVQRLNEARRWQSAPAPPAR